MSNYDPTKRRVRYLAHRDRELAYSRRYHAEHREERARKRRAYYDAHWRQETEASRHWRLHNPDKALMQYLNRMARTYGVDLDATNGMNLLQLSDYIDSLIYQPKPEDFLHFLRPGPLS